jgi:hypothetical protein
MRRTGSRRRDRGRRRRARAPDARERGRVRSAGERAAAGRIRRPARGRRPIPVGAAIRAAAALDAAGAVVARARVGSPPGGQPCGPEDQGVDGFVGPLRPAAPPPGAVEVASAGGRPLLAADRGETLCVGLDELPARLCPPPPVDSDRPRLLRRGGTVAGVLGRDAARVSLHLDRRSARTGGRRVVVGTTDGPAYAGRWAGDVRFFAAAVAERWDITRVVVRNARGAIVGIGERGAPRRSVRRKVLAERGGLGVGLERRSGRQPCLTAFGADLARTPRYCTDLDPGTPIDGPVHQYGGAVVVACAPRAALAYGRRPDRLPAPRIVLDGGRTVRPRTIRLRGEDAWVAFLPDAAVRGLRGGDGRASLRLPPASAQCGYSASRTF